MPSTVESAPAPKSCAHVHEPRRLLGILIRKERWGLSWRGYLAVTGSVLLILCSVVLEIQPFLSITHRVNGEVLVVEGWVDRYTIRVGAKEFMTGGYARVFTTGGPTPGTGGYINDYQTSASVGAELLVKAGVPEQSVQMVPSHVIGRDRTYSSAVALREWLRERNMTVHSFNIVTEGSHARRTRLLFQEAFGDSAHVGIISIPNPDYDPKVWWRYSDGVKEVVSEGTAYLYAKFFFYPSQSLAGAKKAGTSQLPGDTSQ